MNTRANLRIVIAGGTGHLGHILAPHFHCQGHNVIVLSRQPQAVPWQTASWNGRNLGDWAQAIDGADIVVDLAGRSVDCRYNQANRREIMDSRVESTQVIGEAIARASHPPRLWLNASTATIYRHALDRPMDEITGELGGPEQSTPPEWTFSIDVAKAWEQAFFEAPAPNTRKIAMRCAMVMSPNKGGVLDVFLKLARLGLGGASGSGRQFVSWIHDADFLRAVDFLIAESSLEGPINICAPNPLPNCDFMRALRQAYGARVGLAAAEWMLEIGAFFLRTETELVLKSRRVIPTRLLDAGFTFRFPDWPSAASNLVQRWRGPMPSGALAADLH